MTDPRTIAAIDIGSDTVHLLLARVEAGADGPAVRRISQRGELLELGRLVATKGRIGRRAAAELERILRSYVKLGRRGGDAVVVGATEALRRASDGRAVVEHLTGELGVSVRLLSGRREAQLGLAGVRPRLDPDGRQLVIDSGGASTELTMTDGRRAVASRSIPVGASLLGASLRGDPPRALSWALGAARIGAALSAAPRGVPTRAWATGGSAHNLAGLERTSGRSGDQRLTVSALSALATELLAQPARKLARQAGEDPARVRILPPGLLIVAATLAHYELDAVTVVPEGLREGMAAAAYADPDGWWKGTPSRAARSGPRGSA